MITEPTDIYKAIKPFINILLVIITIYILYKIYQYLNVSYRIQQIIPYDKALKWEEIPMCWYDDRYSNSIVADFFTCSSVNTPCLGNLKYDYLHLDVIKKVLMAGSRFIEFTIMANDLSDHPTPVVSRGVKEGQWQTSLNNLPFDKVCYTVKKFAFQSFLDNNQQLRENHYPLFVYLNIKTRNKNAINDMSMIIEKMWGNRLADKKYHYSFGDLAHVPICELFGKIVIMADINGLEETNLNDYINYTKLKKLHFNELSQYNLKEEAKKKGIKIDETKTDNKDISSLSLDPKNIGLDIITAPDHLTEYSKSNLVLVYPNMETDIELTNHDFSLAMSYGCQFVGMNFQQFDDNMEKYMKVFTKGPFQLKNKSLRLDRSQIKKRTIPPKSTNIFNEELLRGAELLYSNTAISLVPYYVDGVYMKYQTHNHKMGVAEMPKSKKSKTNPFNFLAIDLFRLVKGINGKRDTVSFKSIRYPNYYLTLQGSDIKLIVNEHTNKFNDKASFYILLSSDSDDNDVQYFKIVPFSSRYKKIKYVRVFNESLIIDNYDGQPTFKDEIQFRFIKVPIDMSYSFKDYKGKYLRILDGGFLTSNAPNLSSDTKFKIEKAEENHYHIKASNDKYLKYDGIKTVSATSVISDGTHTMFEIIKRGTLYQISTYRDSKSKTIYPRGDGSVNIVYDGNLLKTKVVDDNGRTITPAVHAPQLGRQKYFYLVQSYDIKK